MTETCMVYFRPGTCDLDVAIRALTDFGLTVANQNGELLVGRPGSPQFRVRLVTGSHVLAEARRIAEGTPHKAALQECSARFEILIEDLDAALDEVNTLIEVQSALQDEAAHGYLYLPWNRNVSAPWIAKVVQQPTEE